MPAHEPRCKGALLASSYACHSRNDSALCARDRARMHTVHSKRKTKSTCILSGPLIDERFRFGTLVIQMCLQLFQSAVDFDYHGKTTPRLPFRVTCTRDNAHSRKRRRFANDEQRKDGLISRTTRAPCFHRMGVPGGVKSRRDLSPTLQFAVSKPTERTTSPAFLFRQVYRSLVPTSRVVNLKREYVRRRWRLTL